MTNEEKVTYNLLLKKINDELDTDRTCYNIARLRDFLDVVILRMKYDKVS